MDWGRILRVERWADRPCATSLGNLRREWTASSCKKRCGQHGGYGSDWCGRRCHARQARRRLVDRSGRPTLRGGSACHRSIHILRYQAPTEEKETRSSGKSRRERRIRQMSDHCIAGSTFPEPFKVPSVGWSSEKRLRRVARSTGNQFRRFLIDLNFR